jgi:hypothetical protein
MAKNTNMRRIHLPTALLSLALVGVLFSWHVERIRYLPTAREAPVEHSEFAQHSETDETDARVYRGPGETDRNQLQAQAFESFVTDHNVKRRRDKARGHCCDLDFMITRPISDFADLFAVANQPTHSKPPLHIGLWTIWYDRNTKGNPGDFEYYTWMTYGPKHAPEDLPAYELVVAASDNHVYGYTFALWSR